jgi:hypothetical protein
VSVAAVFAAALPRAGGALCRPGVFFPHQIATGDRDKRRENVKLWTSLLVVGAILAFAAPSAFSAIPGDEHSGSGGGGVTITKPLHPAKGGKGGLTVIQLNATIKKLTKANKALGAKLEAQAAAGKAQAATNLAQLVTISNLNQQIWVLTHPQPITPPDTDPDRECLDSMVCTPEQNCRIWGNECDLVNRPALPEDAATESSTDESQPA